MRAHDRRSCQTLKLVRVHRPAGATWSAVTVLHLADFYGPIRTLLGPFLYASALVLLLTLGMVGLVSSLLTRSVRQMTLAVEGVMDEGAPYRADVHSGDELERLSHAFALLVARSQDLQRRVEARNAELESLADDLQRSNEDLAQFASVVSHDLREPLRTATSYLELLVRRHADDLDSDGESFLRAAVDGLGRMDLLISDLLAYSRAGRAELEVRPVDAGAVADRVVRDLASRCEEKGARVTRDPLPVVLADESQLGQVFLNLISNGLKYCDRPDCHVHLSAEREGDRWRLSVQDNGIGFDMAHVDRVFGAFQRLHTDDRYGGTGIGLALCKRVVERHGGRIWAESAPGEGSTFYFTLAAG